MDGSEIRPGICGEGNIRNVVGMNLDFPGVYPVFKCAILP